MRTTALHSILSVVSQHNAVLPRKCFNQIYRRFFSTNGINFICSCRTASLFTQQQHTSPYKPLSVIHGNVILRKSSFRNPYEDGNDDEDEFDDEQTDPSFPENEQNPHYKDMNVHCKFRHAFVVIERTFNMKENEIEEFFYNGKLRINKNRVGKRFVKVCDGDIVDLIKQVTDDHVMMKRIEILKVNSERTSSGNIPIWIRRWKHLKLKRIVV